MKQSYPNSSLDGRSAILRYCKSESLFLILVADPIAVRWYSSVIADCERRARLGNCGGRAELSGGSGSPKTAAMECAAQR